MIPIPGTGSSVHPVVLIAGAGCLALFVMLLTVMIIIVAGGRRRED